MVTVRKESTGARGSDSSFHCYLHDLADMLDNGYPEIRYSGKNKHSSRAQEGLSIVFKGNVRRYSGVMSDEFTVDGNSFRLNGLHNCPCKDRAPFDNTHGIKLCKHTCAAMISGGVSPLFNQKLLNVMTIFMNKSYDYVWLEMYREYSDRKGRPERAAVTGYYKNGMTRWQSSLWVDVLPHQFDWALHQSGFVLDREPEAGEAGDGYMRHYYLIRQHRGIDGIRASHALYSHPQTEASIQRRKDHIESIDFYARNMDQALNARLPQWMNKEIVSLHMKKRTMRAQLQGNQALAFIESNNIKI